MIHFPDCFCLRALVIGVSLREDRWTVLLFCIKGTLCMMERVVMNLQELTKDAITWPVREPAPIYSDKWQVTRSHDSVQSTDKEGHHTVKKLLIGDTQIHCN